MRLECSGSGSSRQRLGLDIFRQFFDHILELCEEAGLVWGKELLFDATKVQANASVDSVVPRLREVVDGHLVELFGYEATKDSMTTEEPMERWELLEECRLDPDRPQVGSYQRLSSLLISTTDPDATLMRAGPKSPTTLGYHDHYVVDGGKARIILHALVTPADVMENQPMLDQLRRVLFRWRLRPKRVIADTTYGTVENIAAIEEMGIRALLPLADFEERTEYWGKSHFTCDPAADVYRCPEGEILERRMAKYTEGVIVYRAQAAICNACSVKAHCTGSNQGRMVRRSFDEAYLERVRGYHQTEAYQRAMRKRRVWVEPLFAEAKQWHGLQKYRLRGLRNVNIQSLVIAAGQNLKRYLAARGWGRRFGPCGSLWAGFRAEILCACLIP